MSWWVGGSLRTCSFLFFGPCAAAAAHNISTEADRGTAYCFFLLRLRYYYCCFICVYILLLLLLLRRDMHLFFVRGAAAANHFSCWLR